MYPLFLNEQVKVRIFKATHFLNDANGAGGSIDKLHDINNILFDKLQDLIKI